MILTDSESTNSNLNSPIDQRPPEYSPISEGVEDSAHNDNLEGDVGDDELKGPEYAANIEEAIN